MQSAKTKPHHHHRLEAFYSLQGNFIRSCRGCLGIYGTKKRKKKMNWLLSFSPVQRISQADTPDVSNTQKQRNLRSDWGEPSSQVLFKRELSISIPVEPVSKNARGFLMERGAGLGEGPHWSARINPTHCCLFSPLIGLDISQLLNDSGWRFSYKGSARVLARSYCISLSFNWRLMDTTVGLWLKQWGLIHSI